MNFSDVGGPGRHLVIGAALAYTRDDVEPFLSSLRRTGYTGDIALVVDDATVRTVSDLFAEYEVTAIRGHEWFPRKHRLFGNGRLRAAAWFAIELSLWCTVRVLAVVPMPDRARLRWQVSLGQHLSPPNDSRFLHIRKFIDVGRHELILLTDVRDVVFQQNPFDVLPPDKISLSIETRAYTVGTETHNAEWVSRIAGTAVLDAIGDRPVSCVGVTFGDRGSILRYLRLMTERRLALRFRAAASGGGPLDQGMHNVLLWTGELGDPHLFRTMEGPLATLSGVDPATVRTNDRGELINYDGTVPSIVHQYDRQPHVRDRVLAACGAVR